MTAIIPFKFGVSEIRVVDQDGEPWFVLVDVCNTLEIQNPSQAASGLSEDERSMLHIGRQGSAIIVNESGLWAIALTSRKPEAKKFRKWLTSEVIPSIRKTGAYSARVLTPAEQNLANAQLAVEFERRAAAIEARQDATDATAAKALDIALKTEKHIQLQPIATPAVDMMYAMQPYCESRGAKSDAATCNMLGRRASAICRKNGILPMKVPHQKYEKGVNAYPLWVLKIVVNDYIDEHVDEHGRYADDY
jgi:prophage antirepressor-like protein